MVVEYLKDSLSTPLLSAVSPPLRRNEATEERGNDQESQVFKSIAGGIEGLPSTITLQVATLLVKGCNQIKKRVWRGSSNFQRRSTRETLRQANITAAIGVTALAATVWLCILGSVFDAFLYIISSGSNEVVGLCASIVGIAQLIVLFPVAAFVDKADRGTAAKLGSLLHICFCFFFCLGVARVSLLLTMFSLALFAAADELSSSTCNCMFVDSVPYRRRASFISGQNIVRMVTAATGTLLVVVFFMLNGNTWTVRLCQTVLICGAVCSSTATISLLWAMSDPRRHCRSFAPGTSTQNSSPSPQAFAQDCGDEPDELLSVVVTPSSNTITEKETTKTATQSISVGAESSILSGVADAGFVGDDVAAAALKHLPGSSAVSSCATAPTSFEALQKFELRVAADSVRHPMDSAQCSVEGEVPLLATSGEEGSEPTRQKSCAQCKECGSLREESVWSPCGIRTPHLGTDQRSDGPTMSGFDATSLYGAEDMIEREARLLSRLSGLQTLVPYGVMVATFVRACGAGMTIRFFNLYFINVFHFTPAAVSVIAAATLLSTALFTHLAVRIARTVGSGPCAVLFNGTGALLLYLLTVTDGAAAFVALHLLRNGVQNGVASVEQTIVVDTTSSRNRGKWLAAQSVMNVCWFGSAVIGGRISDTLGYRASFVVTLVFYIVTTIALVPVAWLYPKSAEVPFDKSDSVIVYNVTGDYNGVPSTTIGVEH